MEYHTNWRYRNDESMDANDFNRAQSLRRDLIVTQLKVIFSEYKSIISVIAPEVSNHIVMNTTEGFLQVKRQKLEYSLQHEIDSYLQEPTEVGGLNYDVNSINVLQYWKQKASQYPVLHRIALDFLSCPLSSVPSESAFSCAGRILDDYWTRLTPENVQLLMQGRSWYDIVVDINPDFAQ